jgi:hypothetical protein
VLPSYFRDINVFAPGHLSNEERKKSEFRSENTWPGVLLVRKSLAALLRKQINSAGRSVLHAALEFSRQLLAQLSGEF